MQLGQPTTYNKRLLQATDGGQRSIRCCSDAVCFTGKGKSSQVRGVSKLRTPHNTAQPKQWRNHAQPIGAN